MILLPVALEVLESKVFWPVFADEDVHFSNDFISRLFQFLSLEYFRAVAKEQLCEIPAVGQRSETFAF